MENAEKVSGAEEAGHLNRNRSFKTKQLVRSQAIRESQSPPRTVSPATEITVNERAMINDIPTATVTENNVGNVVGDVATDASSQSGDITCGGVGNFSDDKNNFSDEFKKLPVEIQITSGAWDDQTEQRQRTKRWLGHRHHSDPSRDLLSNSPRVACVCGACAACAHCRGRRRKNLCPTKQDSGIVCSDDCAECSDSEQSGSQNEDGRKSDTADDDQTFYCRCPERKDLKPKNNNTLSRNDSDDRSEPSGAELVSFIKQTLNKNARDRVSLLRIEKELRALVNDTGVVKQTLNKNARDRVSLLRIEKELRALVNDTGRCIVRFPVMTSYGRMLVHRCAALFQLAHHIDQNNKTVVLVSKSGTSGGRIPCTEFREWCSANFPPSPQRHAHQDTNAKSILKRDTHSLDEPGTCSLANARSKSLEQREREYERVRRRIFSTDNCNQDESQCMWANNGPVKLLTAEPGRNKLLKVQSLEAGPAPPAGRPRGPHVAKSHSFAGYSAGPRAARALSKQGDLASSSWRLSPSSSGYKTLSLRSTDSVTPSPTGGASPEPAPCPAGGPGPGPGAGVVWCVTALSCVPPGAVLIHPQTGQPLTNPDGSIYHYDPSNPPVLYDATAQNDQEKIDSNDTRRGRLEKQHSFIDNNESECQPSEESAAKCYCDCRRQDGGQKNNAEKTNTQPEQNAKPTTPVKNRYETQTNHNPDMTNHRSYETTNQKPPEIPRQYATKRFENSNFEPPFAAERNFENQRFEATNQRPAEHQHANQRPPSEMANQRACVSTNQDAQEVQYGTQYYQGVRNDEVTSPQASYQQDSASIQTKVPVMIPDPNIRPMSLGNMMYPSIGQGYPYVNPCRMEQPVHSMYQQMMQEEQKPVSSSPHTDSTFRIDPSYPYAGVDYTQCGGCVDPTAMQQRSYNMSSYGQMEMSAAVLPPYPVGNVMMQQPALQHYPYADHLQWTNGMMPMTPKVLMPELYPAVYQCPQYGVYPQMVPQYPLCQPVWQTTLRHSNTATPNTHKQTVDDKTLSRQNSNEIAAKIQHIKEQMSQLNARDKREEWRSGNGILGSCPANAHGERRTPNDETQLTSAARAIVNSIRNMQAKSFQQARRPEPCRPERRRPDDGGGKPDERAYLLRQMSPGTWCRRSPAPVHPVFNQPRRPHPDNRNQRR